MRFDRNAMDLCAFEGFYFLFIFRPILRVFPVHPGRSVVCEATKMEARAHDGKFFKGVVEGKITSRGESHVFFPVTM